MTGDLFAAATTSGDGALRVVLRELAEDRQRRQNRERQMRHRRRHSFWWCGAEDASGAAAEGRKQ